MAPPTRCRNFSVPDEFQKTGSQPTRSPGSTRNRRPSSPAQHRGTTDARADDRQPYSHRLQDGVEFPLNNGRQSNTSIAPSRSRTESTCPLKATDPSSPTRRSTTAEFGLQRPGSPELHFRSRTNRCNNALPGMEQVINPLLRTQATYEYDAA